MPLATHSMAEASSAGAASLSTNPEAPVVVREQDGGRHQWNTLSAADVGEPEVAPDGCGGAVGRTA